MTRSRTTLAGQRARRRERFERTVELLRELGLSIDAQLADITDSTDDAVGRPTVARALIAAGHATQRRGCLQPAARLGEARVRAAARGSGRSTRSRRSGPPTGSRCSPTSARRRARVDVVRELADAGLGGLEVYYRSFDVATVAAVGEVARKLDLVPTGGSDYHGDTGTYAEAHAALWVPPDVAAGIPGSGVVVGSPTQP